MPIVPSSQFPSKILFPGRLSRAAIRGLTSGVRAALTTHNLEMRIALVVCVLCSLTGQSHAQQLDVAGSGSILESPGPNTASLAFVPPGDSGGVFAGFSLQYLSENSRGLNIEGAFRAKEGLYNGYQYYRPVLYDVNWVYGHLFAPKFRGDFMAGVGGETLIFYQRTAPCHYGNGCRTYVNNTHFLMHAGFGLRYRFFKGFFVRPEAHYYFIPNNYEFHSDHVLRFGGSLGYTFGGR